MVHHQMAVFDNFLLNFQRRTIVCILCISFIIALIVVTPPPTTTPLPAPYSHTIVSLLNSHPHTPYIPSFCICMETYSHHGELLESKLKSFGVVGDALGFDLLDGVFQQLLVPDVGLDQVVEAARYLYPGVELEGKPAAHKEIGLEPLVSSEVSSSVLCKAPQLS